MLTFVCLSQKSFFLCDTVNISYGNNHTEAKVWLDIEAVEQFCHRLTAEFSPRCHRRQSRDKNVRRYYAQSQTTKLFAMYWM